VGVDVTTTSTDEELEHILTRNAGRGMPWVYRFHHLHTLVVIQVPQGPGRGVPGPQREALRYYWDHY